MNHSTAIILIGDHRVDLDACTLSGPKGAYFLSRQMVDVIELFAAHAGEAIERVRIINAVWQGDRRANRLLTRCIHTLRRYFGDSRQESRYIETIPGYGYRLIAPVQTPLESAAENVVEIVAPAAPMEESRMWQFLLELRQRKVCRAASLYAVIVWLVFQITDIVSEALRLPEWVLPFVVITGILGFPIAVILAWIFEVSPTGLVLDIPLADSESGRRIGRDTCWNVVLLAASALICLQMLASGLRGVSIDDDRIDQLRNAESIVVTPFRATSVNLETKTYAFALSEQLRHLLRTEFGLTVMAADGPANLTNDQRRADLILEGSVTITPDSARVMVHLVDPVNGHDLWSDEIYITSTRTNSLQNQFAREILRILPIGRDIVPGKPDSLIAKVGAPG